jgi:radical SAM-linked protein
MRVFDRAFRRSGFPIAYSQGFNPRPRMSFASALTMGATSEWELCQCDLARDVADADLAAAAEQLRQQLPSGLQIGEIWEIPVEKRNPYIQVQAAAYDLHLGGEEAAARIRQFLQEGPGIPQARECQLEESPARVVLKVVLPAGERNGVRIRDLVASLEAELPGLRVTRLHRARLWCEQEPKDRLTSGEVAN